jgi:hypothetical protein
LPVYPNDGRLSGSGPDTTIFIDFRGDGEAFPARIELNDPGAFEPPLVVYTSRSPTWSVIQLV